MTKPVIVIGIDPTANLPEGVGFIPTFLDLDDPRPASEQFNERYVYGGWRHQEGFECAHERFCLDYPGDTTLRPIAAIPFRDEMVMIYRYGYVAIWQKDGSFEACRMD